MEKVEDLIKEISSTISQVTSSRKDEVRVMRAMMNDESYQVDVYDKSGKVGVFNPSKTMRGIASSVISGAAKISKDEADALVEKYEFNKNEAEGLVDISKEFLHTYIHTGRKMPLGGREKSDIAVSLKEIAPGVRTFPKQVGRDKSGEVMYERGVTKVKGYESMRVYAPCPEWIRDKDKK